MVALHSTDVDVQDSMEFISPFDSDREPVIFKDEYEAIAKDKEWQAAEIKRCSIEPWYWLINYIWSIQKDENVEGAKISRFPCDEYLRITFGLMFQENFLAVDKSRQMRLTWLMMAYALWNAQFKDNQEIVCQTKKEDVADTELVKRAFFMASNEPKWMRPKFSKTDSSYCRLKFPGTKSFIKGIPKGGDQIRSFNPTITIIDEAGFLEGEFEECKSAALACCKDIKLVSTANAGEWGDFINAAH